MIEHSDCGYVTSSIVHEKSGVCFSYWNFSLFGVFIWRQTPFLYTHFICLFHFSLLTKCVRFNYRTSRVLLLTNIIALALLKAHTQKRVGSTVNSVSLHVFLSVLCRTHAACVCKSSSRIINIFMFIQQETRKQFFWSIEHGDVQLKLSPFRCTSSFSAVSLFISKDAIRHRLCIQSVKQLSLFAPNMHRSHRMNVINSLFSSHFAVKWTNFFHSLIYLKDISDTKWQNLIENHNLHISSSKKVQPENYSSFFAYTVFFCGSWVI